MTRESDFWSRRKARVQEESEREILQEADAREAQAREDLESLPDEEILRRLDLPDPDTLSKGDDFSVFMTRAVPERLRRRALRKLWLSNPALANLDNLVDYGEDYTDAALVIENLQTAYQVGKGMLQHVLEKEASEAEEEASEDNLDVVPENIPEIPEETTEVATSPEIPEQYAHLPESDFHVSVDIETRPVRRRMRFAFADDTEKEHQTGQQGT